MEYKATLDTMARIITGFVALLFFSISSFTFYTLTKTEADTTGILAFLFSTFLMMGIFGFCYFYRTMAFVVERDRIVIKRPVKDIIISIESIQEVFVATKESMRWTVRTFGVGGLFGYFGKFWNKEYGNMTWYATRRNNYIVVVTKKGKKIILTPDQLSMIDEIQRRLKPRDLINEI